MINIVKKELELFIRQLNYKAFFRFLLFFIIIKGICRKSPHFGNTITKKVRVLMCIILC